MAVATGELTRPHRTLSDAGLEVSIATPGGRTQIVHPLSLVLRFNAKAFRSK